VIDAVVDASALVLALVGRSEGAEKLRRRFSGLHLHAPHLIDAEVGNVLRRHELSGRISAIEADTGALVAAALINHRYPHVGVLAQAAWALRHNLSYYDALYVALAGYLAVPLLTADVSLTKAPGLPCDVEVV
jgi:predicted nucleic acid-binding protein